MASTCTVTSCSTQSKCSRCLPNPWHTWPTFIFFSLCGLYFIVVQMYLSKAPDRFLEEHKASKVPLSLTHNTLHLVDKILTPLISFFVSAFGNTSSTAYPTVVDFVWSFGAAILLPLIEAERIGVDGKHGFFVKCLSHPMVWGIFYQRLSGGWILPLWLIAFMQSRTRANGAGMERAKAESVLFGWLFGHSIPAIAMLIPNQPALTETPIWVAFPILMSVAQQAYYFVRTHYPHLFGRVPAADETRRLTESGYIPLTLLYLSAFVGSCVAHIHLVIIPGLASASCTSPTSFVLLNKLIGLTRFLFNFFVPATGLSVPTPAETTATTGVVHFVQFDIIVVFSAVWIALIWDLSLRRQQASNVSILQSITWGAQVFSLLLLTGLALGPGAATAGLLAYRESMLEEKRREEEKIAIPIKTPIASAPNSASPKSSTPRCGRYSSPLTLSPVKAWSSPISPMNRQAAMF